MHFPSLSVQFFAWSFVSSTTRAFSTVRTTSSSSTSSPSNLSTTPTTWAAIASPILSNQYHRPPSALSVSATDTIAIADMERGVGGRIEAAFEAAKQKGEAAFVTFITAGYPTAQGAYSIARKCLLLLFGWLSIA
jgi:hypothetical protein